MAKNRYAPKAMEEVMQSLSVSSRLRGFASQSQLNDKLQEAVNCALGPILCKKCRVSHYRDATLFLEAASATLATRLQYMRMEILSEVRRAGYPECAQIKISSSPEAQTRMALKEQPASYTHQHTSSRTMSEETAHHLEAIAQTAPDGLKQKLLKLAQHAKK
jgi:hypothetical protein